MFNERKRTAHMIHELIGYFQHLEIADYRLEVKQNRHRSQITISGYRETAPERMEALEATLNERRQDSLEGYYDELLTLYDEGEELSLLSIMVNRAELRYENKIFSIFVERLLEDEFTNCS